MAEDIAPALLEQLKAAFLENLEKDRTAAKLLAQIEAGTATYATAGDYAEQVGRALADAFSAVLTYDALPNGKIYPNIAEKVIRPLLVEDHNLAADAAAQVQTALNKKAGIGLKAQRLKLNEDRVSGLLKTVSAENDYYKMIGKLNGPVIEFSRTVVDETVKANAEFQTRTGLRPKISRRAEYKCCEWCRDLAGEYTCPDVPDDIYRRHENCRCVVEYDPGSGKKQNVHTKKWTSAEESARIENRKVIGLSVNNVTITEVGEHVTKRMAERTVEMDEIVNAINHPLKIKPVKINEKTGLPSFQVVGEKATVSINPDTGKITTTWRTSRKLAAKLKKVK